MHTSLRRTPLSVRLVAGSLLMIAPPMLAGAPRPAPAPDPNPGANTARAPEPASLDLNAPLPTDPSLVTGRLPNGVRYIIRQHATPPGRVHIWTNIASGSLNETDEQRGLAHYLEHMAFNGSENFPPGTLIPFFESIGLTFGRHQNAFTSFDQTTYQLALPDTNPEHVSRALQFMSDVLFRLSLRDEEIEAERQIILEEKRARLSPRQRVGEQVLARLVPGSRLAERLPIGTEQTILSVQRRNFLDYYRTWYTADNATVMVVADVEPPVILEAITRHFGPGPAGQATPNLDGGVRPPDAARAIVVTDPELTGTTLTITRIDRARPPTTSVGHLRRDLVETIGQWAFNRRMQNRVAAGTASFLTASASASDLAGVMRQAGLSASGQPEQWRAMLAELGEELQRARLHGFSAEEVEDARRALLSAAEQAVPRESTTPAGALIARYNRAVVAGEPIMSAAQRLELLRALLPGIRPEEVGAAFAEEFDPRHATFVYEGPSGRGEPTEDELLRLGRRAVEVAPARTESVARAGALMDQPPRAGSIAERATHADAGVTSAWLSNNVRVHHRFMDQRRDDVAVTIVLAAGAIQETAENRGVSEAAGLAFSRPATARLSSTQIRDLMTGRKASVNGSAGTDTFTLTVAGSPVDLEHALQLAHLLLTEPRIEGPAFEQWKTRQIQAIEARRTQPQGVLAEIIADTLWPAGEVRGRPLTRPQVERLTLEAAQARLDQVIATAPIEVSIVGDLPLERALELASRYLGSLPTRERISPDTLGQLRRVQRPRGPIEVRRELETRTPQAVVLCGFFGPDARNIADTRRMSLAARILSTRMIRVIREEKQLVYSIAAQLQPGETFPGMGLFMAAAPTEPAKTGDLAATILQMYRQFAEHGPTAEELDVAKRQIANTLDESMKEPGFWRGRLAGATYRDVRLDDIVGLPAAYQAMTAEEVRSTFASYFTPESTMTFVVVPRPPAGAEAPKPVANPAAGD
jgi:zinc protease